MKFTSSVGALVGLLLVHGCTGTTDKRVEIASCDDLQAAASSTRTQRVEGELTATSISCPEWTSFDISENRLKLVAGRGLKDEDEVTFSNVRFVVSSELRVKPPVRFMGDAIGKYETSRQLNGGVLAIKEGGRADFLSAVRVKDVMVDTGVTDPADVTPDAGQGGCFYNEGRLRFLDSLKANGCRASTSTDQDSNVYGDGGTIWNGESGRLTLKGAFDIECGDKGQVGESRGGGIYNAGKIDFYEDIESDACYAARGAIIYNEGRIRFYEDSFVHFGNSYASYGGHVYNSGKMFLKGGAFHRLGNARRSGGGLYNSGKVIYSEGTSVTFDTCGAADFGGAIALTIDSTFDLPGDAVFDRNYILYPADDDADQCDDIYLETKRGYTCLTSWP